ncbi:MAG TPA: DUF1579 family protein [Fimbriiglobus sp.]|jgi:hypothetical protein
MFRFALFLGVLTLATSLGTSQPPGIQKTTDQPPPQKRDPQQAIEPKSDPGAGQKFLQKFVGNWDVEKKFFPRGGGEPTVSKGTCKQELIHAGHFLQSEFRFDAPGGGKATGTGLIGFEPSTGLFTSVWADSRQTRMSFRKSKEKFDGEKIVLYGMGLGSEPTRQSKTYTTLEDKGAKIVHKQVSVAADGTERPVMQLTMTKKAGPATGTSVAK